MDSFDSITPAEACLHPNWSMGRKISVDSATMMNKGLELIEACFLFGVPSAKIDIVIHPQSVVHSMVAFEDGSVLAQMGQPDMRTPIASALAWPERMTSGVSPLDFVSGLQLSFRAPDHDRFPLLDLCRQVAAEGQSVKVALNAANEVAVDAFLQERIRFTDIERIVKTTVDAMAIEELPSIEAVLSFDSRCRLEAQRQMTKCF
jgi:1-deoxy-D-xylulose-5-phosphate reductoisomerase